LAEYLQVSRSTVDLAYSQLLSEGYIESKPWVGHYVCRVEELFRLQPPSPFQGDFRISGENGGLYLLLGGKKGQQEKELIEKAAAYVTIPLQAVWRCGIPFYWDMGGLAWSR
jgi:DNA-binding transcriptional MocR family regulator